MLSLDLSTKYSCSSYHFLLSWLPFQSAEQTVHAPIPNQAPIAMTAGIAVKKEMDGSKIWAPSHLHYGTVWIIFVSTSHAKIYLRQNKKWILRCFKDIWGLWCQKQVYQAGISNCIPQYSVGFNYLSLPEIPASVLICPFTLYSVFHCSVQACI